jgi:hypothetical protein
VVDGEGARGGEGHGCRGEDNRTSIILNSIFIPHPLPIWEYPLV